MQDNNVYSFPLKGTNNHRNSQETVPEPTTVASFEDHHLRKLMGQDKRLSVVEQPPMKQSSNRETSLRPIKFMSLSESVNSEVHSLAEIKKVEAKLDRYLQALAQVIGEKATTQLAQELKVSLKTISDLSYATGMAEGFLMSDELE